MSNVTEVDMKDVELNEVEQEKQPMTEGEAGNNYAISPVSEKNGVVKVKIPEKESKFTGLSKEELMKVAGTPGYGAPFLSLRSWFGFCSVEVLWWLNCCCLFVNRWVKVRWALLILFWLGWLGMLAGAIALIIQAPRCKPLPEMNWWNYGPLYQIGDVNSFTESSKLMGKDGRLYGLTSKQPN